MQRILQPITEHFCDSAWSNVWLGSDFSGRRSVSEVWKGCELRCLLFYFAT
jgi:hypothetical protein